MRLHRLKPVINLIIKYLNHTLKSLNVSNNYIIDTFPAAVCRNIRIKNCRLLTGKVYHGFNNSKREWFYGFKVQIITTQSGIPVQFNVFCGEIGDVTAFQSTQINLPEGSNLYGDKACNDYDEEDLHCECEQIYLKPHQKVMQFEVFLKKHIRKQIENSFAIITDLFPGHIHATSTEGFLLKILLFVLAFTIF